MKVNCFLWGVLGGILLLGCYPGGDEIKSFLVRTNGTGESCFCITGSVTKIKESNFLSPSVNSTLEMQLLLHGSSCVFGSRINVIVVTTANTLGFSPEIGNTLCVYYTEDPLQIVKVVNAMRREDLLIEPLYGNGNILGVIERRSADDNEQSILQD